MNQIRKPNSIERDLIAGLKEFVRDLKADNLLTAEMEASSEIATVRTVVQNRRIEVTAPNEIPDGTEVTVTITRSYDNGLLAPEEISRLLLAMKELEPWDIPDTVLSDLEDWERKINDRGIEHRD